MFNSVTFHALINNAIHAIVNTMTYSQLDVCKLNTLNSFDDDDQCTNLWILMYTHVSLQKLAAVLVFRYNIRTDIFTMLNVHVSHSTTSLNCYESETASFISIGQIWHSLVNVCSCSINLHWLDFKVISEKHEDCYKGICSLLMGVGMSVSYFWS